MNMEEFNEFKSHTDKILNDKIDSIYKFCEEVNVLEFLSYNKVLSTIGFDIKNGYGYMGPLEFEYLIGVFLSLKYDENKVGKGSIEDIGKLLDNIKEMVASWKLSNSLRKIEGKVNPEEIANGLFEANLISTGGTMRGYSYYQHTQEIDMDVLRPFDDELKKEIGFTVTELKKIMDAIEKRYTYVFQEFQSEFQHAFQQPSTLDNEVGVEIFQVLHEFEYGNMFLFTEADIISIDESIDKQELQSFLEYFSVKLGCDLNNNYRYLNDENKFRDHPIIKVEDSYLLINLQMIFWCFRERIEEQLKPKQQIWKKYNKYKSDYLETKSLEVFRTIFPKAKIYSTLFYQSLDGKQCELDGLIQYDNCILLIEAKSGSLTKVAKNGGVQRLKKIIQENIEYAGYQANRAKEYILNNEKPIFKDEKKRIILEIDKNGIENIYLINITMDYFSELSVNLNQLKMLGYYKYNDFPWSVSLSDLRVISDFIEFPNQLLHYIYFRGKFNNKVLIPQYFKHIYELDLFGFYLYEETEELEQYFIEDLNENVIAYNVYCNKENNVTCNVLDFSGIFNEFYNAKYLGLEVKKPKKRYNKDYYKMVRQLEEYSEQDKGYTNLAIKLLDLDNSVQNSIINLIHYMVKQADIKKKCEIKSMPYLTGNFDNNPTFGITIVVGYKRQDDDLMKVLKATCIKNTYQYQYKEWVGLICWADSPKHLVNNFMLVRDDIEKNYEMDEILKSLPKNKLVNGKGMKLGRNSPCPCGSGNKYKKCCYNK